MSRHRMVAGILAMLMVGNSAFAAVYSWTGGASTNNDWDDCENWSYTGDDTYCRYPISASDDVRVNVNSGGWEIDLITVTIDDMDVKESVDFDSATGNLETVTADDFTVEGGTSGVSLTFTSNARIQG